jgi:hypothetical protein
MLRVLDTATGRASSATIPSGCERGGQLGHGLIALNCSDGGVDGKIKLLSVRSGNVVGVPVRSDSAHRDEVWAAAFLDVGRYWVHGEIDSGGSNKPGPTADVYVNRMTGEVRSFPRPDSAWKGRDLDSPDLPRLPFVRCGVEDYFAYDAPYVLDSGAPFGPIAIHRCGVRKDIILDGCRVECSLPNFVGGVVTWTTGMATDHLHAFIVRGRIPFTWHVRDGEIAATRYSVLISDSRGRLLTARLPGR